MKTRAFLSVGSAILLVMTCGRAAAQLTVYDNLAGSGWSQAYPTADNLYPSGSFTDEFGDEIILLANGPRTVTSFTLQYYTENLFGNVHAQIRFYENDGALSQGFPSPNKLLYDSGSIALPQMSGYTSLTLNNLSVTVPDSFTWTVQFSGISQNEAGRSAINAPQNVGLSYDDFWQRTGSGWTLVNLPSPLPGSFGASISAVPEPAATAWVFLASAAAFVLARKHHSSRTSSGPRRPIH